jgi:C1A family cysteine protease
MSGQIKGSSGQAFAMGWTRDNPDYRDYTMEDEKIKGLLKEIKVDKASKAKLPAKTDLRVWCTPVEDQESLGACTAHAGVGILEYFENKAYGNYIDASRLFLYKATRNLLGWTGDTGAYLRSTMASLALFGVPPEKYWPYDIQKFEDEPTAFIYSLAQNFQALIYYRLDPPGISPSDLLKKIKTNLAAGLPSMFGFTVYSSYSQTNTNGGKFPYPSPKEKVSGGHAVVAIGYDDKMKIKNSNPGGIETTGAVLIRNSWGTNWGDGGYGWLPYKYILDGLAVDWWSLINAEWISTGQFGL